MFLSRSLLQNDLPILILSRICPAVAEKPDTLQNGFAGLEKSIIPDLVFVLF